MRKIHSLVEVIPATALSQEASLSRSVVSGREATVNCVDRIREVRVVRSFSRAFRFGYRRHHADMVPILGLWLPSRIFAAGPRRILYTSIRILKVSAIHCIL
jgi:hypothetical protein